MVFESDSSLLALFSLNHPLGRFSLLVAMSGSHTTLCVFLQVFSLSFILVLGQNAQLQKRFIRGKFGKGNNLRICNFSSKLVLNCPMETTKFLVFMNHLGVHSGELAGGWSMAVAVGVKVTSDM